MGSQMVAITNSHTPYTYGCFRHCTGTSLIISTYCSNGFFFINLTSTEISSTNLFRQRSISFPHFNFSVKVCLWRTGNYARKPLYAFRCSHAIRISHVQEYYQKVCSDLPSNFPQFSCFMLLCIYVSVCIKLLFNSVIVPRNIEFQVVKIQ